MKTLDVIIVTMVSWALLVPCTSAQANGLEWFGLQGQYKCRCTDNRCDENGTCTDGARCQGGWFGPACQYADLAYNRLPTLTDGNDTTCITSTSSGSVTVTLDNSYWFTWLRVHLNNPGFLHRLTVHFDSNTSCPNSRISTVDNTTLDIYCDLNEKIQSVTLTVDGIEHLCSIYVNGGRNVALKQSTTQSSNYSENSTSTGNVFKYFPSTYAVDGNTSGNFYKDNTCTHTQAYSASNPTWSVTFSNLQNVTRFLVYNREDGGFLFDDEPINSLVLGSCVTEIVHTPPHDRYLYRYFGPPS